MFYKMIVFIVVISSVSGCASSADLNKSAMNNERAADYYESIGQPGIADEERQLARDNYNDASSAEMIIVELISELFSQ